MWYKFSFKILKKQGMFIFISVNDKRNCFNGTQFQFIFDF